MPNDRKPSQLSISLGLSKYMLISTLRNRNSLVFGLIFPLIFVFVFGFMGGGNSRTDVALSQSLVESKAPLAIALQQMSDGGGPIKIQALSDADLESKVSKGQIGAGIEMAANGDYTVVTSTANPMAGATASGILSNVLSQMNLAAATKAAGPSFKVPFELHHKDIAGKTYRYIDFVLPGMIGFSLISTATFGVAFPFLALRRTLVLKRMLATSAKPLSFVVSQCLSRSVQAVFQSAIIIAAGVGIFHFTLPYGAITFVEMLVIAFLGICSFMGFGILIANIAKDEQTAPLMLNLFNLPQFLIGGVFFPLDQLPTWVQFFGRLLPLSILNDAMRKVATDGQHLFNVLPQVGGLLVWSIIAYVAAAKTFRTE